MDDRRIKFILTHKDGHLIKDTTVGVEFLFTHYPYRPDTLMIDSVIHRYCREKGVKLLSYSIDTENHAILGIVDWA